MKCKQLRLIFDDLKSLLKGNYHNIATQKVNSPTIDSWYLLSQSELAINWREELGTINHNRIHNIRLGAELINNVILRPKEVFSLKYFLKGTSKKQGFKDGPMFKNGEIGYVLGGGVCLLSTVLFDAALKANLEIVEKHNHSTDLWGDDRFIDLGRDATYVHGLKDLKLKNNSASDIIFQVWAEPERLSLTCKIFSRIQLVGHIEIEKRILKELLPAGIGERAKCDIDYRKGWIVETTRFLFKNGRKIVTYAKKERYEPFLL
jgi:vancomycin resistance protein VanW